MREENSKGGGGNRQQVTVKDAKGNKLEVFEEQQGACVTRPLVNEEECGRRRDWKFRASKVMLDIKGLGENSKG